LIRDCQSEVGHLAAVPLSSAPVGGQAEVANAEFRLKPPFLQSELIKIDVLRVVTRVFAFKPVVETGSNK